jgi:hypothetical protein
MILNILQVHSFLLYLLSATVAAEPVPVPKNWPIEFAIKFETNITSDVSNPVAPVTGINYYDWNIKSQRVDHAAGNYECLNFYNSNLPCTLLFLPDGMYRILQQPLPEGQEECCLDLPGVGANPPDWTSSSHPSYDGVAKEPYSGYRSYRWVYDTIPNATQYHMYYEVAPGDVNKGRPLIFTFPGADGRQDYHYIPSSLEEGPQSSDLFKLPEGCANKLCSTTTTRYAASQN